MYKMNKKSHKRLAPVHGFLAAAVLGLAVMPIAFAGAAQPTASTSGALTAAKFKKLKQRVAALEANGGVNGSPTGPAGGDLTGQYPTPTIRANAVNSAKIANDTVSGLDIEDNSVTSGEINANSLTDADLAPDSVGSSEIGADTVGSSELKGITTRVSPNAAGSNNSYTENSVTCGDGEILLAGGYAWQNDSTITMTWSAPSQAVSNAWIVRGKSSTSNNLFAWANCLAV